MMIIKFGLFLLSLLLFSSTSQAVEQDEIKNLPGVDFQLKFRQYSGYLDGGKGRKLFYWFVESAHNSSTDPLMLWLNGGPGCSSLAGLFTENGPFRVKSDSKTLELDPYSWNQLSNVLYLESPYDVGFSYNETTLKSEDTWNDESVTDAKYNALVDFFTKYPQFKSNDFYITGESYFGVYIPLLTRKVLERNHTHSFNLKGISIGNGFFDQEIMATSHIDFAYYHGMITMEDWRTLKSTCCHGTIDTVDQCDYPFLMPNSTLFDHNHNKECTGLVASKMLELLLSINVYNVYDDCVKTPDPVSHRCVNRNYGQYLNLPEVKKALHVNPSIQKRDWVDCNNQILSKYQIQYNSMDQVFRDLIDKHQFKNIVLYNGDIDIVCDFLSAQRFLFQKLKLKTANPSKYWKFGEFLGGTATHFESGLRFFTVHGAGHMVSTQKPK